MIPEEIITPRNVQNVIEFNVQNSVEHIKQNVPSVTKPDIGQCAANQKSGKQTKYT